MWRGFRKTHIRGGRMSLLDALPTEVSSISLLHYLTLIPPPNYQTRLSRVPGRVNSFFQKIICLRNRLKKYSAIFCCRVFAVRAILVLGGTR